MRALLHDDRRPVASHPSEHAEEGLARLALVGAQLLALGVHVGEVDARGAWLGFRLGLGLGFGFGFGFGFGSGFMLGLGLG